jgi:aspartyl/asparaginyl-tRNA synthetase
LAAVKRHFPHEDLVWLEEKPRIPFKEGVQMLADSGWKDENGYPPSPYEDLHTRDEIRLGELVKEKYHTDYYIVDRFPAAARPFYTIPDPEDPKTTISFDLFLRGQEILTGGQHIHEAHVLEEQVKAQGVDPSSMEDYTDPLRSSSTCGCRYWTGEIYHVNAVVGQYSHRFSSPSRSQESVREGARSTASSPRR